MTVWLIVICGFAHFELALVKGICNIQHANSTYDCEYHMDNLQ